MAPVSEESERFDPGANRPPGDAHPGCNRRQPPVLVDRTEHCSANRPNTMFGGGPDGTSKVPRVRRTNTSSSLRECSVFGGGRNVYRHGHLAGEHGFCCFGGCSVAHEVASDRLEGSAHLNVDPSASGVGSGTLTTFWRVARRRPTAPAMGSVASSASAIALVVIGPPRSASRKRSGCEALRVSAGESARSNAWTVM